jgi:hypothetical protein
MHFDDYEKNIHTCSCLPHREHAIRCIGAKQKRNFTWCLSNCAIFTPFKK